ncbi:zeta toxin family protein [Verrucomicrobium spinosum]|uniref:zeta toxin family protein n=1 Tax=Verrucomicrobium spinosum TaxID=2736 RepID=UPI00017449CB|nr:zeta toxin family protein [Verrucomicrobium spinosum]
MKAFGADVTLDKRGLPVPPRTPPDGYPLLQPTREKKTAILDEGHVLVRAGLLPVGLEFPRRELRQVIVNYFLGTGAPVQEGALPTVTAAAGGGASGKSTVLDALRKSGLTTVEGAVTVNPDDIAELIPEFDRIVQAGDSGASELVHQEASQISGALMDAVLALPVGQRPHIIYDSTLSRRESALRHFNRWHQAGFQVQLLGVTIDVHEAETRAAVRAKKSGRWIPSNRLLEAHQGFNQPIKDYVSLVDRAHLYDTSTHEVKLVVSKESRDGQIEIANRDIWDIITKRGATPLALSSGTFPNTSPLK